MSNLEWFFLIVTAAALGGTLLLKVILSAVQLRLQRSSDGEAGEFACPPTLRSVPTSEAQHHLCVYGPGGGRRPICYMRDCPPGCALFTDRRSELSDRRRRLWTDIL
jgi:hypothetical protein